MLCPVERSSQRCVPSVARRLHTGRASVALFQSAGECFASPSGVLKDPRVACITSSQIVVSRFELPLLLRRALPWHRFTVWLILSILPAGRCPPAQRQPVGLRLETGRPFASTAANLTRAGAMVCNCFPFLLCADLVAFRP